eukprot:5461842-Lingulodinium_polyedra.AAC.1
MRHASRRSTTAGGVRSFGVRLCSQRRPKAASGTASGVRTHGCPRGKLALRSLWPASVVWGLSPTRT